MYLDRLLFSVIIIFYNSEEFVAKSVESVINQSYSNWELILVNDGSTDGTRRLCEQYEREDERVRVIDKKNGGIASARNAGIEAANGEYFLLIDGDDYIDKAGLKQFADLIEQSQHKADYIFGKMSYFYEETGKVYRTQKNLERDIIRGLDGKTAFCRLMEEDGRISMGVRGAFRTAFVRENEIQFPDRYFEDVNVIMQVLIKAQYVMVNTKDYYYFRDRIDSTSKKSSIRYVNDIIIEMNWWECQIVNESNEEFSTCVKKEIDRRTKAMVYKYARRLVKDERKQLALILCENTQLFYPYISFRWRLLISPMGIEYLRVKGLVKEKIKCILKW